MKKTKNYFKLISQILIELKAEHPNTKLGSHLSTALEEHGDLWGIEDEKIFKSLKKYQSMLTAIPSKETEIDKIIEDGMNLSLISLEQEED